MTAFFRTDGIRAPGVIRLGNRAVVFPFAIDAADRMDWNEIDDVEAEPRDFGEAGDTIIKRSAFAGLYPLAAREHFIPSGKACRLAVDDHLQFMPITHRITAHRIPRHGVANFG